MHSEEMAMGLPPRPQTHHAAMRQSQELTYSDVARMPIATLQQVSPMMHSKAMAGIMHANNVFMYQVNKPQEAQINLYLQINPNNIKTSKQTPINLNKPQ